jgi:dUTP diphosphatase
VPEHSDYRGEVRVILINLGQGSVTIQHGDRIAQLIVAEVARLTVVEGEIEDTARGAGGFGSTG